MKLHQYYFIYLIDLYLREFSNRFKTDKIITLFKDGDRSKQENYRPIYLLPQFSQLLEKLIKVRILKILNKFNIISDMQYGFRKNVSTSDAFSDVIETVNLNLEHLNNCAIASIELCKDFDTLDNDILIKKLSIYGIRGIAHKLLESYLKDRQ